MWRVPGVRSVAGAAWLLLAAAATARDFVAEGVDGGAGLGARQVAMGGTGVAHADDVLAAYYNPAGLVGVQGLQLVVSRQLDARLRAVQAAGVAWRLPLAPATGWDVGVAALFFPRIHARADGAFDERDFESLFLRYLLPGISGTFDGRIDSKTKSWRLALGAAPRGASWSLGGYVERIDCKSSFCGVHATSNGYTESSTGARATAVGIGLRWKPRADWQLGLSVSDLDTRLDVETITTDAAGTRSRLWHARFPRKLAAEAAYQRDRDTLWSLGFEAMRGAYGQSRIDIQMLRAGWERRDGAWAWRLGALAPLRITSTETGALKPPAPVSPTLGLGWKGGSLSLDAALYAHPVMSMHEGRPSPSVDLTLGWRF